MLNWIRQVITQPSLPARPTAEDAHALGKMVAYFDSLPLSKKPVMSQPKSMQLLGKEFDLNSEILQPMILELDSFRRGIPPAPQSPLEKAKANLNLAKAQVYLAHMRYGTYSFSFHDAQGRMVSEIKMPREALQSWLTELEQHRKVANHPRVTRIQVRPENRWLAEAAVQMHAVRKTIEAAPQVKRPKP